MIAQWKINKFAPMISLTRESFGAIEKQLLCILGQNAIYFGLKHSPFWAKTQSILGQTHSILRQNAFHFAAKRSPFCGKTQSILRQNAVHFAAKQFHFLRKTPLFSDKHQPTFIKVISLFAAIIQSSNDLTFLRR